MLGMGFMLWISLRAGLEQSMFARLGLLGMLLFLVGAAIPRPLLRNYFRAHLVVLWFVLGVALFECLGWFDQSIMGAWRYATFDSLGTARLGGPFFHPNLFAFYLLISLIVLAWCHGASVRTARSTASLLVAAALVGFCLMMTFSRGVILAAGGIFLLMLLAPPAVSQFRRASLIRFAAAVMVGAVISVAVAHQAWMDRTFQTGRMIDQAMATVSSGTSWRLSPEELDRIGRREIWQDAMSFATYSPLLGIGAGEFWRQGRGFYHPHNALLDLWLAGGLVGLALLAAFARSSLRERRFRLGPWHLFFLAPFVGGLFDSFLFFKFPFCLFALSMGVLSRSAMMDSREALKPRETAGLSGGSVTFRRWREFAWFTAALFVLGTTYRMGSMLLTQYPIDFYSYYAAVRHTALTGTHPYVAWPSGLLLPEKLPMAQWALESYGQMPLRFFYPPTAIALFAPLAFFENPVVVSWLYFGFQMCLLALVVLGVTRLSGRREAAWVVAIILVSHAEVMIDLLVGNVSLLMGTCALWCWILHRRGNSGWAGALLSVAVAIKIFPVMWLGLLFVERRGAARFLAGFAGGLLFLVLLSINLHGVEFWRAYRFWVLDALSIYPPDGPNSSLLGLLNSYRNPLAEPLRLLGLFALGLAILWSLWRTERDDFARDAQATAVVALSILAVPIAWSHYHLIPLGLLLALFVRLMDQPREPLLYCVVFCIVATSLGYSPVSSWTSTVSGALSMIVVVLLPVLAPMMGSAFLRCKPTRHRVSGLLESPAPQRLSTPLP